MRCIGHLVVHGRNSQPPAKARQAVRSIASVGRDALNEMDRFIGRLRSTHDTPASLRPSLANLERLIEEFRELGLEVDVSLEGDRRQLPAESTSLPSGSSRRR